uniref:G_PROTEIN_RECEP_F1_2 domain-containing protein n=1 Tax=Macrostomum lignano TaxID=282301 RepID=A0A1I8GAT1_9PLAT
MEADNETSTTVAPRDCIEEEDDHHRDEFACPMPDVLADKIGDCVVLSIFIAIGVIGNLLLIISILTTKRMQKPQYYFILSIASADLLVSGYVLPCVLSARISNKNIFTDAQCIFNAFVSFACTGISNSNFCAIALNRYCFVIKRHLYDRIFTGRSTLLIILLIWVIWFIYSGVEGATDNFTYLADAFACFNYDEKYVFSATFMLAAFGVFLPLCISCFAYGAIFWKLYRIKANLGESADTTLSRDERRAIFTIMVAFLVFNACWVPYLVQVITEKMDIHLSNMFHKYSVWMSFFNSSMNAIVYGLLNAEFRASYLRVIKFTAFKSSRSSTSG